MQHRIGLRGGSPGADETSDIHIIEQAHIAEGLPVADYVPGIQNAAPRRDPVALGRRSQNLFRVTEIIDENTIRLDNGMRVRFLGVKIRRKTEVTRYQRKYVRGKTVTVKIPTECTAEGDVVDGYVYLKNRIFVNAYLLRAGWAFPHSSVRHTKSEAFSGYRRESAVLSPLSPWCLALQPHTNTRRPLTS